MINRALVRTQLRAFAEASSDMARIRRAVAILFPGSDFDLVRLTAVVLDAAADSFDQQTRRVIRRHNQAVLNVLEDLDRVRIPGSGDPRPLSQQRIDLEAIGEFEQALANLADFIGRSLGRNGDSAFEAQLQALARAELPGAGHTTQGAASPVTPAVATPTPTAATTRSIATGSLPLALRARVAPVRQAIGYFSRRSNMREHAQTMREYLDAALRRRHTHPEELDRALAAIERATSYRGLIWRPDGIAVDVSGGHGLRLLDEALDRFGHGDDMAAIYRRLIRDRYRQAGEIELGRSPRSFSNRAIQGTRRMRRQFLDALDGDGIDATVRGLWESAVSLTMRGFPNEHAAVAAGHGVWVSRQTGARLRHYEPGAAFWPRDHVWRTPYQVDHIVELQHMPHGDHIGNWVVIRQRLHNEKRGIFGQFERAIHGLDEVPNEMTVREFDALLALEGIDIP